MLHSCAYHLNSFLLVLLRLCYAFLFCFYVVVAVVVFSCFLVVGFTHHAYSPLSIRLEDLYFGFTLSCLFDEQQVSQKEEEMGNRRLTALAGLFVSNSYEDIRIEFTALEPGWQIKGSTVKVQIPIFVPL